MRAWEHRDDDASSSSRPEMAAETANRKRSRKAGRLSIRAGIENSILPPEELSQALAGARQGDEDGIRVLYRWLNPRLLRYLRHHAAAVAEDLASEVWMAVARGLAGFDGGAIELRAFVFTVARRRIVDHRRLCARQLPTVPIEEAGEQATLYSAEDLSLEWQMTQRAVEMLVHDLPAEQAEVVLLRVLGDLSVAEVAVILGKTPGAVRVAQHRGLRRLSRKKDESGVTI